MKDKKENVEFKSFIISFVYIILFVFVFLPLGEVGYSLFIIISIITIIINIITRMIEDEIYINSINTKIEYDYWRDINFKNITPVEAGKLLGVEQVGINTFITILFELRKKQIINIEHINNEFYISLKNTNIDEINKLPYYESSIIKLLFKGTNDDSKIELNELISVIKNDPVKKVYLDDVYKNINRQIELKYYTSYLKHISNNSKKYLILLIISNNLLMNIFVGFIYTASLLSSASNESTPYIVLTIIVSVLQVLMFIHISKYQYVKKEYLDEIRKLNGLYNYIIDFSNINEKELKYYELYKEYFLYAVSMGIADKYEMDLGYNEVIADIKTNIEMLLAYKKECV